MKKGAALWFVLFVLLFGGVVSAAGDVAYIYRAQFRIDDNIVNRFNAMGLDVDFINERDLPMDLSSYQLLFVGDENFRREQFIPVHDSPTVVANYYHMDFWGYTDEEGVSRIAANSPLNVIVNNQFIQVYTQATESAGGPSISYYYLDETNKAASLENVASAETTDPTDGGDVISRGEPGDQLFNGRVQNEKMCFFGIVESDFWTQRAENLFSECVQYVAAECSVDADCPSDISGEFFCQDGNVVQSVTSYSCVNGGLAQCVASNGTTLVEECSFGCSDGACLDVACFENSDCNDFDLTTDDVCHFPGTPDSFCTNDEITCYVDSDCGDDRLLGEPVCSPDNDVVQLFEDFECVNPGTGSSFCTSSEEEQVIQACVDLCSNGECIGVRCFDNADCNDSNPLTLDECLNPGSQVSECRNTPINCGSDADCGFTGFLGTEFCTEDAITKNFQTATCTNAGTLNSFCTVEVEPVTLDMCEAACVSGGCVVCDENLDCDDGNSVTLDKCLEPGSVESRCINEAVECFEDSDCGPEGLFGNLFCMDLNVTQQFKDFTCHNPGNASSFCTVEILPIVNETCDDLCIDGGCAEIACNSDSDCDDGDSGTADSCENPGTSNSFCTHDGIACFLDSECGTDEFIGDTFCSFGDVYQNFVSFQCDGAGTADSSCDSSIEERIVEDCQHGCSNGACLEPPIICEFDSDCGTDRFVSGAFCSEGDVTKVFREYNCLNAGTPQSDCTFTESDVQVEACELGCEDAACVAPFIECSVESDCGIDGFIGENFCSGNNVKRTFRDYSCLNAGTPASECVFDDERETVRTCSDICVAGSCADVVCYDDFDCGVSGLIGEPYCSHDRIVQLFEEHECVHDGTEHSFCQTDVHLEVLESCEFGCDEAMCVAPVCESDVDCDDGNSATVDQCVNQGTVVASCVHTHSACVSDLDCGVDRSIGVPFCQGDAIYQNFQSFMCLNSATTTAACIFDVSTIFVNQCDGACYDGNCIVCDADSDCDDGDSGTADVCLMPGTAESHCSNEPIGGGSCSDECVSGSRECTLNGFRVCGDIDGDGCSEWGGELSCGSLEQCVNGYCVIDISEGCSDECLIGSQECFADGLRTCGDFDSDSCSEWSEVHECGSNEICLAGSCIEEPSTCTNECTNGARECTLHGFRVCGDIDGDGCSEWGGELQCGTLEQCVSGFCV